MTPIVDGLKDEYGRQIDVDYANVKDQKTKDLARQYGIIGYPAFLFLDSSGERVNLLRGVVPQSILEKTIDDLLSDD